MIDSQLLLTIPLFQTVPEAVLAKLANVARVQYFKKGTVLFNDTDASHYFIYAIKGWVKLCRTASDGTEVIVDVFNDHQYSGETFIFEEKKTAYFVEAISDLEILIIPNEILKKLVTESHALSLAFLKATLNKHIKLTMEVEHLSVKNAMQRLGCFLLRLCATQKSEDITIKLPYDKSLLASRLGIRPETFSRILSKTCDAYHIQIQGDTLRFKSVHELAHHVCLHCSKAFPCGEV